MRLLDSRHTPQSGLSLASFAFLFASTTVVLAAARYEAPLEQAALKTHAQSEVQEARRAAAQWLVSQQQADGRWMISAKANETVSYEFNEARTTALAVRALLGEIKALPDANFERAMRRGVAYLESSQDAEGCFGSRDHNSMMYAQGAVLRALCEFDAYAPSPARLDLLKRSVEFLLRAQNPYRGWRYNVPPDGDNDSKITATILIALAAAEARGVEVHPQASDWGLEQLRDLTDPETGRTGFSSRGTPATRYSVKRELYPSRYSEEPTAMQLLAYYAWDHSPLESKSMRQGLALLTDCLPKWSVEDGSIDYSYWMEGAEVMARAGGYAAKAWRAALTEALVPHRIQDAEDRAHWPANDAWSDKGMEVYATATALLALQALS